LRDHVFVFIQCAISKRMDHLLDLVDFTALFIGMVYEDDEQADQATYTREVEVNQA
jgi:hypothetical protein